MKHAGDDGHSDLIGPDRPLKSDPVFDCLGWIDELTSAIGVLRVEIRSARGLGDLSNVDRDLRSVQTVLVQIMGSVAWNREKEPDSGLRDEEVERLESLEQGLRATVVLEHRFIIPGDGIRVAAFADLARARCRTTERSIVALQVGREDAPGSRALAREQRYLNRLSDYLYLLARYFETEGA